MCIVCSCVLLFVVCSMKGGSVCVCGCLSMSACLSLSVWVCLPGREDDDDEEVGLMVARLD